MPTISGLASQFDYGHGCSVLTKAELLAALEAKGVKNTEMERVLGLPSSRVSEIRYATPGREPAEGKKPRDLTYDEGVKLVRAFGLEQDPAPPPLPLEVLRLVARYLADSLGVEPSPELLQELSKDLRAFAVFVGDPTVRKTVDSAQGFFRALRLPRPEASSEAPPESDPHRQG